MNCSVAECMDRVSNREFLSWQEWWKDQWNEPDRHDWYLMQIASTLVKLKSKNPEEIKTSWYKMPFTFKESTPPQAEDKKEDQPRDPRQPPGPLTREQVVEFSSKMAQSVWKNRMGK